MAAKKKPGKISGVRFKSAAAKRARARLKKLYGTTGKAKKSALKGLRAIQEYGGKAGKGRRAKMGRATRSDVRAGRSAIKAAGAKGNKKKSIAALKSAGFIAKRGAGKKGRTFQSALKGRGAKPFGRRLNYTPSDDTK